MEAIRTINCPNIGAPRLSRKKVSYYQYKTAPTPADSSGRNIIKKALSLFEIVKPNNQI